MSCLNYAGISENTTAQVFARYATDCVAHNPGIVVLGIGVNDVTGNVPIATTKANILNLVAQNRAIGAPTILFTIAPKDDHTTAQKPLLSELNRWIVTLGAHGDVYPADVASAVVSLTGMT